jgi:RsiW-degrading membrane proteinase PrsW (M82 family)
MWQTIEILIVLAYLLPIVFLAAFIGNLGRRSMLFLAWGCIAAIPVFFLVPVLVDRFPEIVSSDVTLSPVLEEFFKALPLVIAFAIGIRMDNREILTCAMASGIGFSIIENWVQLSPMDVGFIGLLVRSFSTCLMHGCTCAIIGYGLVLIRGVHRAALPALMLGFFMVAVMIHALFNMDYLYLGTPGFIADLVLPLFLFLFLLVCYHVDLPTLFRPDTSSHE